MKLAWTLLLAGMLFADCAPASYYSHWQSGKVEGTIIERKFAYDLIEYRINGQTYIGRCDLPPAARLKVPVGSTIIVYWWTDGESFVKPHAP